MQALKASPEHEVSQEPEQEVIVEEPQPQNQGPRVYTVADFERWWARSEELNSILRRLPRDVIAAAGMENRREQLLERWEDLETPEIDESEVDEEMLGALMSWIRDSETLIHYIIYTRDITAEHGGEATANDTGVPTATASAPAAPSRPAPVVPSLQVINSMSEAIGVKEDWHWPWLEGWDDPEKRERILKPKKKKEKKLTFKRAATMGALGAGAVYVFARYLDE